MSKLLRAWYTFLGLGLLTFIATAFLGQAPYPLTSVVASPVQLFSSVGTNLRGGLTNLTDRRDTRAENTQLSEQVAQLTADKRALELELSRLELLAGVRRSQSPGATLTAPVTGLSPGAVIKELSLGSGKNQGVKPDMPATTTLGLVGIVTDVTARSSRVRAVTDPQSRVGVTVRASGERARGRRAGRGGGHTGWFAARHQFYRRHARSNRRRG